MIAATSKRSLAFAGWLCAMLFLALPPAALAQDEAAVERLNGESVRLYRQGEHEKALPIARQAVDAAKKVYGSDSKAAANTLNTLGAHLRAAGRFSEAVDAYRQSYALWRQHLGSFDPTSLDTQLSLGYSLNNAGEAAKARAVFSNYVAEYERQGQGMARETHNAREVLAGLAYQAGDLDEAIDQYRQVLAIRATMPEADAETTARLTGNLGALLSRKGKHGEAVPLLKQALADHIMRLGPDHNQVLDSRFTLATALIGNGAADAAREEYERGLASLVKTGEPNTYRAFVAHQGLGGIASASGETSTAIDHWQKALEAAEAVGMDEHQRIAVVDKLAGTLTRTERQVEAEPLLRQILKHHIDDHGAETEGAFSAATSLAENLQSLGKFEEAERLLRDTLATMQTTLGAAHADVGSALSQLGWLLAEQERAREAVPLLERAVRILKDGAGAEDTRTLTARNNLALSLVAVGRLDEAITIQRDELEISRRVRGPDDPETSKSMNNLALSLEKAGRVQEARDLLREALRIDEKTSGRVHPNTAIALMNYSSTLRESGGLLDIAQAKMNYRRVLDIYADLYGPDHINRGWVFDELGGLEAGSGNHEGAAGHFIDAARVYSSPLNRASLGERRFTHVNAVASMLEAGAEDAGATFEMLQWPMRGAAGNAIDAMAVRASAQQPELRRLVRRQQDAREQSKRLDETLLAALSSDDTARASTLRARRGALSEELQSLEASIAGRFPQFKALAGADPLSVAETAALLRAGEALIVISPGHYHYGNPVAGSIHVVKANGEALARPLEAGSGLIDDFGRLRCSFLPDASCAAEPTAAVTGGTKPVQRGAMSVDEPAQRAGFDTALAHDLYRRIFGPVEAHLEGVDHLIVVVDHDTLASLPMQVLLRAPVGENGLYNAHWLIRDFALSALPSVEALRAIRGGSRAASGGSRRQDQIPFLGVGDPVIGSAGPMNCGDEAVAVASAGQTDQPFLRAAGGSVENVLRSASVQDSDGLAVPVADATAVRQLARLPDTRCELQAVSRSLGGGDLLLENEATERVLKDMNAQDRLRDYRIISFATHGLVSGEAGAAEPALVLTPPAVPTVEDDGLLTASEVAALKLDADWVLLSACNTAAGDGADGESLSGLARAFFYAGARSLLVSHWPVSSPAAVRLTTGAFDAMQRKEDLGRAQAMRLSILAILDDPLAGDHEIDPAYWAPFSVIGEGGPVE